MLSHVWTNYFDYSASVLLNFGFLSITGVLIAMLLAYFFGGKSLIKRQLIFSVANFGNLCTAAYFAFSNLTTGG